MGATTGNDGRTEGMPEVQISLLEHAAPKEEITGEAEGVYPQDNGVVKSVTCPESGQLEAIFSGLEPYINALITERIVTFYKRLIQTKQIPDYYPVPREN